MYHPKEVKIWGLFEHKKKSLMYVNISTRLSFRNFSNFLLFFFCLVSDFLPPRTIPRTSQCSPFRPEITSRVFWGQIRNSASHPFLISSKRSSSRQSVIAYVTDKFGLTSLTTICKRYARYFRSHEAQSNQFRKCVLFTEAHNTHDDFPYKYTVFSTVSRVCGNEYNVRPELTPKYVN